METKVVSGWAVDSVGAKSRDHEETRVMASGVCCLCALAENWRLICVTEP